MIEREEITKTGWNFDNSYARLPKSFFENINPTPVRAPKLIILNKSLAKDLGLDIKLLKSDKGVEIFAGNEIPEGTLPLAQAYAGHQFGHFTMLGDGRALLLGEHIVPSGEKVDIQLKGSGRTPYSRGGDGRASLGPMLREYIISEAMHALGIPTTRSLAVVKTGETVFRERELEGAILTRVASSHLRVGTFEYVSKFKTIKELQTLADYSLQRHYPESEGEKNPYLFLLQQVVKRQASTIAKWQLIGFIHGVMNTDNMTISGETIDYGPCAFMDTYDPSTVFSSIDTYGRYAYGNQPNIGQWNLARFGETLLPLIDKNKEKAVKLAQDVISEYTNLYYEDWLKGMRAKLGLYNVETKDESLIKELLDLMQRYKADYTNTFKALSFDKCSSSELFKSNDFTGWYKQWKERLTRQQESNTASKELMRDSNPAVIPRNHRVEEALEAAVKQGDYSLVECLIKVLTNPYAHSLEQDNYSTLPPSSDIPYQTFCGT